MLIDTGPLLGYPGYVSRDCPLVGAKESITVDWTRTARNFYTVSKHKIWVNGKETYPLYYSTLCNQFKICYETVWRSYAGQIFNIKNTIYSAGVWGYHYWDNLYRYKKERRTSYAIDCNLESWDYDNWDS